jgi:hypothetical protein
MIPASSPPRNAKTLNSLGVGGMVPPRVYTDGEDRGRSGWVQREFVRGLGTSPAPPGEATPANEPEEVKVPTLDPEFEKGVVFPDSTQFINDLKRQRAEEAAEEKRKAEQAALKAKQAEIEKRAKRAESLLATARNLERLGKPKGAIDFYRKIIEECRDAPCHEIAEQRVRASEAAGL